MNQNVLTSNGSWRGGQTQICYPTFRSVLARKVPATLACARLSDSMVGTYLPRAKRKQEAGISHHSQEELGSKT